MGWFKYTFLLLSFSFFTNAYYHYTHEFLGNYLENYLKNNYIDLFVKAKTVVHNESFGSISTWADRIKSDNHYKWSKQLHYIDINSCSTINLDSDCNNNCIYTGILNMTNDLKFNKEINSNYESFKFLIHFLQDFNQPMHLLGFYRGGNDYHIDLKINGHIRKTNLHTLWDSIIPEYYIHNYHYDYTNTNTSQNTTNKNNFVSKINSIYDYDNFLKSILFENLNITCNLPISQTIDFDNYFNKETIKKLFDNYMKLTLYTLSFIFSTS